jgi:hypothetical protein
VAEAAGAASTAAVEGETSDDVAEAALDGVARSAVVAAGTVLVVAGVSPSAIPSSAWLSTPSPFASRVAKLALISERQKLMVVE